MPFLAGFGKRKELRYGTAFPSANLADFPKLFTIAGDSDIAAELASGGGLAVTAADGETTVPFGLYPSSDLPSGDLILRAKVDLLTAATTGDVIGYLYYDSTASTTEDKAGVVSNGYALFMPLEEDPSGVAPQMLDWVSESTIGTSTGSMTSGDLIDGVVGKGLDFDGLDDSVAGSVSNVPLPATLEIAFRRASGGDTNPFLLSHDDPGDGYRLQIVSGELCVTFGGVAVYFSGLSVSLGQWYYGAAAITANNGVVRFRLNGGTSETGVGVPNGSPTSWRLGRATFDRFSGAVDEARISSVARSADWLAYAYADDFENADTFTLGPEETDGGGPATFDPAWASQCNVVIGGQVW